MGKGGGNDEERKSPAIDRNETAVWKLPVGVSKLEFQHWIDTIDTNFDAAMGLKYPEVVLDRVKSQPLLFVNVISFQLLIPCHTLIGGVRERLAGCDRRGLSPQAQNS